MRVRWGKRFGTRWRLFAAEDALAITEYGVLVALVALAVIAVVAVFGTNISSWFAAKTSSISTV